MTDRIYTPEEMREVARINEGHGHQTSAAMLRQGATALEALAAKDTEIARLTTALTTRLLHVWHPDEAGLSLGLSRPQTGG